MKNFILSLESSGASQLNKMIEEGIEPASLEEMKRWETNPTPEEYRSAPDIKYLRFLHPLLRVYVIENWNEIKKNKHEGF